MAMSTTNSSKQNEDKKLQDSDIPNIQSSPPTRQEPASGGDPPKKSLWRTKVTKLISLPFKKSKGKSSTPNSKLDESKAPTDDEVLTASINSSFADIAKLKEDLDPYTSKLITYHLDELDRVYAVIKNSSLKGEERRKVLENLYMDLIKLKIAVPPGDKAGADKRDPLMNLEFTSSKAEKKILGGKPEKMPHLYKNDVFEASMEFKEFVARYNKIDDYQVKLCLLCFSIFPAGVIIKKRLMVQWWVAEGYASSEEDADGKFNQLIEKGFIEAVKEKRSLSIGSCKIHPFNHCALVALAESAKFFNFEAGGKPTQDFSECFQACLVGDGLISYQDFPKINPENKGDADKLIKEKIEALEKLHLLMNVDERILEVKHEWFGKMKNVNVLYLGRWNALPTHHIEVEDVIFLEKGLGNMSYVKFLSLQGVSNIISLPDSILKLTNVSLLDLRACYNLEKIPEDIGLLGRLTHLDMSECYLLAHMPKSLSKLKRLKVLKGFFVDQAKEEKRCTLGDLKNLKNLEKLCIYTNWKDFPETGDVEDLGMLEKLRKLTITWGVGQEGTAASSENANKQGDSEEEPKKQEREREADDSKKKESSISNGCLEKLCFQKSDGSKKHEVKLPASLEKLDLKCFPKSETPEWLKRKNLKHTELKKLYIRGGKFRDVGQQEEGDEGWGVEKVRLKYLAHIEMEWKVFQELFPKLKYLEQVSCPRLTFFPCDAKGVWIINPTQE